jgi:hypothetical protein
MKLKLRSMGPMLMAAAMLPLIIGSSDDDLRYFYISLSSSVHPSLQLTFPFTNFNYTTLWYVFLDVASGSGFSNYLVIHIQALLTFSSFPSDVRFISPGIKITLHLE